MSFESSLNENPNLSLIAVTWIFFVNGSLAANWIVRIPDFKARFFLDDATLGLVLTGAPIGSVIVMLLVGFFISKYGSKFMTMLGTLCFHLGFILLPFVDSSFVLWAILMFFGSSSTIMDVSMNSQGVEVEKVLNESAMSSFHAFFSIGGFIGSIVAGLLIRFGFSISEHFIIVFLVYLPISLIAFQFLQKNQVKKSIESIKGKLTDVIQLPPREIWLLGLITLIAVFGEMMMNDWSLIFVKNYTLTTSDIAALAFASFSLFMTIGRLIGDKLTDHFLTYRIVTVFAIIASVGLLISALIPNVFVFVIVGFSLFGLGLSIIVPLCFKAGGNRENVEVGSGVASVVLFAYIAALLEPIFIGQVSKLFSLQIAFLLVAIITFTIVFMAKTLKPKEVVKQEELQSF